MPGGDPGGAAIHPLVGEHRRHRHQDVNQHADAPSEQRPLEPPSALVPPGEEVDAEEVATGTSRTLTIEFLDGAEEIEIIGTFAIPEFGTIAALILAVAIVSIIAISARSRLNVLPKY